MKYKLDFKKYRKSDVEKYKNISNKILQSERADLIDMSPDFYRTQVSWSDLYVWLSHIIHKYTQKTKIHEQTKIYRFMSASSSERTKSVVWVSDAVVHPSGHPRHVSVPVQCRDSYHKSNLRLNRNIERILQKYKKDKNTQILNRHQKCHRV